MAKGTVVRGTPVNVIRSGSSGINPQKPAGYNTGGQTVRDQFEGDQSGNRQVERQIGKKLSTQYNSDRGNPGDASTTRADYRYGVILSNGGQDMNNPASNGNGVFFDKMSRANGYMPPDARHLDSPVPNGAPMFQGESIKQENLGHLGQGIGASPSQAEDVITKIGGVMSRGMVGSSTARASESQLTSDDTLGQNENVIYKSR